MTTNQNSHIAWVDLLRIVACFVVVLAHSLDPFTGNFDNQAEFLTGVFGGSFTRACVPLFVMVTGVLLLPVKMDMTTFYKKRAKRVLIPLIIWSLITPLLYYLYFNFVQTSTTNPAIDVSTYTFDAALTKMYTFVLNFNYDTTPLWYLYMLIGLYLFMPILSSWVSQASRKDMKIFLYIWLFTTALPYLEIVAPLVGYEGNYGSMGLLGNCFWNPYGTFYYFSGFLGYLVFAHYLVKYPLNWSFAKTLAICIPLFMIGYLSTSYGFLEMQEVYPGNYQYLEIVWYFSGINVLMMTFSVFVIFSKLNVKPSILIAKISSLTFGVYLIHFLLVQFAYDLVYPNVDIFPIFKAILGAIIAFVISLAISWLLSLNKVTRKSIM